MVDELLTNGDQMGTRGRGPAARGDRRGAAAQPGRAPACRGTSARRGRRPRWPRAPRVRAGPALAGVGTECLGDGARLDLRRRSGPVRRWSTSGRPGASRAAPSCRCSPPTRPNPAPRACSPCRSPARRRTAWNCSPELGVRLPAVYDGEGQTGPVRTALKVPPALPASYLVTPGGEVRFIDNPRLLDRRGGRCAQPSRGTPRDRARAAGRPRDRAGVAAPAGRGER